MVSLYFVVSILGLFDNSVMLLVVVIWIVGVLIVLNFGRYVSFWCVGSG